MKRTITEQEIEKLKDASHHSYCGNLSRMARDKPSYCEGYVSGYTTCAESSVPLELFREVVDALKKTAGELYQSAYLDAVQENYPFHLAAEIAEKNPSYLSAQEVLNKAKSYLP